MVVLQKLPGTETQKNMQSQALSLCSRSGNVKARCPRLGAKVTLVELSDLADCIGASLRSPLSLRILTAQLP